MKQCSKCHELKELDEFGDNKARKSGKQSYCKSCRSQYAKDWYNDNQALHKGRVRDNKIKVRRYVYDYLTTKECVDCGEKRIPTLQFDHLDSTTKIAAISAMISNGAGIDQIAEEIKKCVVRCANCHAIRTAKQFNWYNYTDAG